MFGKIKYSNEYKTFDYRKSSNTKQINWVQNIQINVGECKTALLGNIRKLGTCSFCFDFFVLS